jgi:death-on-curing family protein
MLYNLNFYTVTHTENDKELHKSAILNFLKLFYSRKNITIRPQFNYVPENKPYRITVHVKFEENGQEDDTWRFLVLVPIITDLYKNDQTIKFKDGKEVLYAVDPWIDADYWAKYIKLCMKHNFKVAQKIRDFNGIYNIKDPAAFDSIANTPFNSYKTTYFYPDVLDKAAIILYNIVKNHPFSDGNKRTAFLTLISFLNRCGLMILLDDCSDIKSMVLKAEKFMITVASSDPSKRDEIIDKIKEYIMENINIDTNFQNTMIELSNKN